MKILLLCLLALPLMAQQKPGYDWQTLTSSGTPSVVMVPTTSTAVVSVSLPRYVKVGYITLHNITASSVTVYMTDGTQNCNNLPCSVLSAKGDGTTGISIAANSSWSLPLGGQPAGGGVFWYAGTANAVEGFVGGWY